MENDKLEIMKVTEADVIEVVNDGHVTFSKAKKKAGEARPSTAEEKLTLIEMSIVRNNSLIVRKKKENADLLKRAKEIRKHLEALDKLI